MSSSFLAASKQQFAYYKSLAEKTFAQVDDPHLFWQDDINNNSIAIIVQHLWGNMLSRWTNFLDSDGEKASRNRDAEFEVVIQDRATMLAHWEAGWQCLFQALDPLKDSDLEKTVYIRNQEHTISEAIIRQIAHYAYHVGQIVFIGKMMQTEQWQSLSIPKGKSDSYNQEKFKQAPR